MSTQLIQKNTNIIYRTTFCSMIVNWLYSDYIFDVITGYFKEHLVCIFLKQIKILIIKFMTWSEPSLPHVRVVIEDVTRFRFTNLDCVTQDLTRLIRKIILSQI